VSFFLESDAFHSKACDMAGFLLTFGKQQRERAAKIVGVVS
jgi:hypothetical protein